jgi:hypothetical protein
MKRISIHFLVFVLTFVLASLTIAWLVLTLPPRLSQLLAMFDSDVGSAVLFTLKLVLCLGMGAVAGLLATRRIGKRPSLSPPNTPRRILAAVALFAGWVLVVSYFLTWVLAVPAVVSHLDHQATDSYKKVLANPKLNQQWDLTSYPSSHTWIAFPVAPGLVLTYHEYAIDPLFGAGLVQIHSWFFGEPRELYGVITWIS